jgi:hypothetical protein
VASLSKVDSAFVGLHLSRLVSVYGPASGPSIAVSILYDWLRIGRLTWVGASSLIQKLPRFLPIRVKPGIASCSLADSHQKRQQRRSSFSVLLGACGWREGTWRALNTLRICCRAWGDSSNCKHCRAAVSRNFLTPLLTTVAIWDKNNPNGRESRLKSNNKSTFSVRLGRAVDRLSGEEPGGLRGHRDGREKDSADPATVEAGAGGRGQSKYGSQQPVSMTPPL